MKSWLVFLVGVICGSAGAWELARRVLKPEISRATAEMHGQSSGAVVLSPEGADTSTDAQSRPRAELDERIAALKFWSEKGGAMPDYDELYETMYEWSQRDPQAVLAWVNGAKRFPQRLSALATPLAELGRRNPAEAGRWIRENIDANERAALAESVFQRMAQENPREALTLVFSFPMANWPQDMGDALGALIVHSSEEALGYFGRLTGPWREQSARAMLAAWARKDADAALAWGAGQPGLLTAAPIRVSIFEELMTKRPEACVDFLRRFPTADDTGNDSYMLSSLLQRSPEHGLEALALVDKKTASEALTRWVGDFFETAPERGIELVRQWVPAEEQSSVIKSGFESWLNSDQRSAMAWFSSVTQPDLKAALNAGVLGWQTRNDPEAAMTVLNNLASLPEAKDVVTQALNQWMDRDIEAVAQWTRANPGLITPDQSEQLTHRYLERDEAAGASWLAQLPAGPARDAAVSTAAVFWAGRQEPELATEVARSIRDPEKRTRVLFNVYQSLRSNDQAGAERWLTEQGLTTETMQNWRAITGGR